ncbi:DUF982 domain-containing protein [Rhizobium sp. TRM95796]|uniref:DUF982 domain-containing protein n=1 Tax=Rhizobium sp. TRM95796 TaxID=2979862 RepID=UPI0021E8F80F|nr:DUF982 domain-containing protein [Rhizobium sp. TRM95796]MCV3766713.1 DUF982 domain-containing protein [Rhizobium sp. TRM95796]
MTRHMWQSGVLLGGAGLDGRTVRIADTRAAAEFLLSGWGRERKDAYLRAVRACAQALKGQIPHAAAAATFVSAAVEARYEINVFDAFWDDFDAEISRAAQELIEADFPYWAYGDSIGERGRA